MAVVTFAGTPRDPLLTLRRPATPPRLRRSPQVKVPAAWLVLWHELLALDDRALVWDAYLALAASTAPECRALAQELLLWPHCAEQRPGLTAKNVTAARLIHCCELLALEGRLSLRDVGRLEEAVLRYTTAEGQWVL
jgi:hypothetical protein